MFFNKEQIDLEDNKNQQNQSQSSNKNQGDDDQQIVVDGQNEIIDFNEDLDNVIKDSEQSPKQVKQVDFDVGNSDVVDFNEDDINDEVEDEHTIKTIKKKKIDDENISQMSQRSRQDFQNQQKKQIKERQKIDHDSPTKFLKNQSFFKEDEDVDYSKYLKDEEKKDQDFQYEVKYSPAQLTPLKIEDEENENESPIKQQNMTEQQILQQSSSSPEQQFDSPKKNVKFIDSEIYSSNNSALLSRNASNQQSSVTSPKLSAQSNQITFFNKVTLLKIESIPNIKQFMFQPIPHQNMMQFTVERDTSGTGMLYGKYHLYLSSPKIYLATAKRLAFQKTSQYVITLSKTDFAMNTPNYIGKLRSNFLGTEFMLYDNGLSPNETKDKSKIRQQLCLINYENNIMQTRMPKRSRIILPLVVDNQIQSIRPTNPKDGLLTEQKIPKNRNITYFEFLSKNPIWNEKLQGYMLNFSERVNAASIKNTQLIQLQQNGHAKEVEIIYQFGKHSKEGFNLDIRYPFSPIQAFAVCVTTFDYKLGCE